MISSVSILVEEECGAWDVSVLGAGAMSEARELARNEEPPVPVPPPHGVALYLPFFSFSLLFLITLSSSGFGRQPANPAAVGEEGWLSALTDNTGKTGSDQNVLSPTCCAKK